MTHKKTVERPEPIFEFDLMIVAIIFILLFRVFHNYLVFQFTRFTLLHMQAAKCFSVMARNDNWLTIIEDENLIINWMLGTFIQ